MMLDDTHPTRRARARAAFIQAGLLAKLRQNGHLEKLALIKTTHELHEAFDLIEKVQFGADPIPDAAPTAPELPPPP